MGFNRAFNPSPERIKRAKLVALIGVVFLFLSWFTGGYYYVNIYGNNVKPLIKEGPFPWAHSIVTETKEHVFLFLPFLAILNYAAIKKYEKELVNDKKLEIQLRFLAY
jgi:glycopeptide antibiotics resistance protein